jgi:hypothetical protein
MSRVRAVLALMVGCLVWAGGAVDQTAADTR